MTLGDVVIFKCKGELKSKLEDVATRLGISKSAIARNSLALAILPPENKSILQQIAEKAKQEVRDELYVREERRE